MNWVQMRLASPEVIRREKFPPMFCEARRHDGKLPTPRATTLVIMFLDPEPPTHQGDTLTFVSTNLRTNVLGGFAVCDDCLSVVKREDFMICDPEPFDEAEATDT